MTNAIFQFERRGLLLVLSAPSGCGKSVVLKRLLATQKGVGYSVSVTSRPPRANEVDGREYHFVSRRKFELMVGQGAFYEWAEVHGNLYGTRADAIDEALGQGRDMALDLDVQGGVAVKRRVKDAVLVFLMPPSLEILEQRLRGRATESEEQICRRMINARTEMESWRDYDYVVINAKLEDTVGAVSTILEAERYRARRLKAVVTKVD